MLVDVDLCSKNGGYDPKQAKQATFRVSKRPREDGTSNLGGVGASVQPNSSPRGQSVGSGSDIWVYMHQKISTMLHD